MPFDVFELVLFRELDKFGSDFYFLQVGANDGVMNDSLNPLIRRYGLKGCLVEPLPDIFSELVKNYHDQPQLTFLNCMIGASDGNAIIHRFKRDAPVPAEFYHGLAREDGAYIRSRAEANGLLDYIEATSCRVYSFKSVISELPVKQISMLYIDTEGSDDKIIEAAFKEGVFPSIIQYEWTELPANRRYALKMLLLDHGYRFIDIGADTVCLRNGDAQINN